MDIQTKINELQAEIVILDSQILTLQADIGALNVKLTGKVETLRNKTDIKLSKQQKIDILTEYIGL